MSKHKILKNPWMDFASYGIKDASRFKGREEEIKKFLRIIDSGTMSVLYANTGIGKTSFLNAGISHIYQKMGYFPIHIVFPDEVFTVKDMEAWLLQRIKDSFVKQNGNNSEEDQYTWESTIKTEIEECKDFLWWHLHTKVMKDHKKDETFFPLLVFDQFEEIFTKSRKYANNEIIKNFFKLICQLASTSLPHEIEQELEKQDNNGNYVEIDSEHHYKVVFSLRKEYLSDFDYWTNDVNSISELHQNRMYLLPLTREQAIKVITQQPIENSTEYYTTLNRIKDIILDLIDPNGKNEIEPFILSALCSKLYNKAVSENKEHLDPNDVDANISNIVLEIYEEKVNTVFNNSIHQKRFEDILVDIDGHRNRPKIKELDDISFADNYQKQLEDAHLIRIDTYEDDTYIELIHDLLAKAINKKRKEEEKVRYLLDLQRTAKRMKKKQRFLWAVIIALIIVGGSILWHINYNQQKQEYEKYHTINVQINVDTAFIGKPKWEANVFFKTFDNDSLLFLCHINEDSERRISFQLPDSIYQKDSICAVVEPTDSLRLCLPYTIALLLKDSVMQLSINYNKDTTYPLRGRVINRYQGGNAIPVNQAFVSLNGEVVQSDENGNFLFLFKDYLMTKRGCLTVFKRDFRYMQYELEFLRQQSGHYLEVELPLYEDIPMDSLFERKRKAIDNLHRKTTKLPNRNTATTEEERKWMREIAVLDTIKSNLRNHSCISSTELFCELNFVSCDDGKNDNLRPIYGWFKQEGNFTPHLFYGTMFLLDKKDNQNKNTEYWRIRVTSFEKKTFHTTEHSFIMENPRSIKSKITEIEY